MVYRPQHDVAQCAVQLRARTSDDGVGHPIYDFERIDLDLNSMGRGWCWNEIIIDWDINPICLTPPLCPEEGDPVWLSLLDKDKTIWEAALKDQSQLIIPMADNPLYAVAGHRKVKAPAGIPDDR